MLRSSRPEDAEDIATVLIESRRIFLPFAPFAHPEQDVRRWVQTGLMQTDTVVLAEEDGVVVGVLAASQEADKSWINQLYILPGWNGKGIGTRLLQRAHSQLPKPIHLYTFQENAGARRFYERNGYEAQAFTDGQGNEEKCPDVLYVHV
jgi:GNAT superfamily N-acetyltransferase